MSPRPTAYEDKASRDLGPARGVVGRATEPSDLATLR